MLTKVGGGRRCGSRRFLWPTDNQRTPRVSVAGRTKLLALVQTVQTDAADHVAVQMSTIQQTGQLIDAVLDRDASHLDGLQLVGQRRVPLAGRVGIAPMGLAGTQYGHAAALIDGRQDGTGGIEGDGGDGGRVG